MRKELGKKSGKLIGERTCAPSPAAVTAVLFSSSVDCSDHHQALLTLNLTCAYQAKFWSD